MAASAAKRLSRRQRRWRLPSRDRGSADGSSSGFCLAWKAEAVVPAWETRSPVVGSYRCAQRCGAGSTSAVIDDWLYCALFPQRFLVSMGLGGLVVALVAASRRAIALATRASRASARPDDCFAT